MSQSQQEEPAFEKRLNADKTPNKKYVDVLDEDKPIANQKFVCVSFVSPETILKKKDVFLFQEFVKQYQLSKSMEKYHQFLNFVSYKFNIPSETLLDDFKEFAKEEIDSLKENDLYSDYKNFLDVHEDKLTDEFNRANNFQTSVRGMKVRGVYPTQEEAELRCKMLREIDPHHDVYVTPKLVFGCPGNQMHTKLEELSLWKMNLINLCTRRIRIKSLQKSHSINV